jgi:hypothetical protein
MDPRMAIMNPRDVVTLAEYLKDGVYGPMNDNYSREVLRSLRQWVAAKAKQPGWQQVVMRATAMAAEVEESVDRCHRHRVRVVD